MFFLAQPITPEQFQELIVKVEPFTHKRCALMFMARIFSFSPLVCFDDVIRCYNVKSITPCFSFNEMEWVWQTMLDHRFIAPIVTFGGETGKLFVCLHRNVGVDYKNRRYLCRNCRREIITRQPPEGDEMGLQIFDRQDEAELIAKFGPKAPEPIEWPDEID